MRRGPGLLLSGAAVVMVAEMLSGCAGMTNSAGLASAATAGVGLSGRLRGGQQPVVGALIQLYAAGTSGYGGNAVPLLNSAVYTDASGGFTITGQYTCPSASTQVYLLATGGNPGLPGGQTNPDLALMAGLGSCGNLTSSTFVAVNEVTTVATAYALAGFMTSATQVSSSGTALAQQGLANAFGTIGRMVDVSQGAARALTPAGNATVPQSELDTLANILSACVNSAGSGANGSVNPCATMETAAANGSGTRAANTVEVALNMAHLPGQGVSSLWNLQPPTPPFQPTLAAQPSDWTVSLVYGTSLSSQAYRGGLAVDGSGNVWAVRVNSNSVRVIGSDGTEVSGTNGYALPGVTQPTSVALDLNGTGWVGGSNGVVAGLTAQGSVSSGSGGYSSGFNVVNGVAVGIDNTLWLSNRSSVSHLTTAGAPVAPTPAPVYSDAYGVAVDSGGNTWFADTNTGDVSKLPVGATSPTSYPTGYDDPYAVAIGRNDHVWVADFYANPGAVSELDNTGVPISGSPYSGGSLYAPWAVAMDGDNHAWFGLAKLPLRGSDGYGGDVCDAEHGGRRERCEICVRCGRGRIGQCVDEQHRCDDRGVGGRGSTGGDTDRLCSADAYAGAAALEAAGQACARDKARRAAGEREGGWVVAARLHCGVRQSGGHLRDGEAVARMGYPGACGRAGSGLPAL